MALIAFYAISLVIVLGSIFFSLTFYRAYKNQKLRNEELMSNEVLLINNNLEFREELNNCKLKLYEYEKDEKTRRGRKSKSTNRGDASAEAE